MAAAKAGVVRVNSRKNIPVKTRFHSTRHANGWSPSLNQRGTKVNDASPIHDESKKDWYAIVVKGAPDIVLNLCNKYTQIDDSEHCLNEEDRKRILDANDNLTKDALRILGLAYKLVPNAPKANGSELDIEDLERDLVCRDGGNDRPGTYRG